MNPAKLIAAVMLVSLTMGAGLEINRAHLAAILKNASLLVKALVANFVLVPIYAVLLARGFRLNPEIATGVLLMAIAPGVPFVMIGARKKGGTLALAVAITVFFPLISVFTVPLTASLVLPPAEQTSLPLSQFLVTLVLFQLVPLIVGMVISERLPNLAAKLTRPLRIVFLIALVVLLAALSRRLVEDVGAVFGSNGFYAMTCVVLLSILTGWILGGPDERNRRTLSLGTALRNVGLCALIATTSFGASSRVTSAVLSYLLVQIILTSILGAFFKRAAQAEPAAREPAVS